MSLKSDIEKILKQGKQAISKADVLDKLDSLRVSLLGRKGELTQILRSVGTLSKKERPEVGKAANQARIALEKSISDKKMVLEREVIDKKLQAEAVDITLPGKHPPIGKKHIINQIIDEVIEIFIGLGYNLAEGPEVETDYYNFEALNTPRYHPARSLQDTFYIENGGKYKSQGEDLLLRTHTSPVQVRVMEKRKPPLYIIAPGVCYRHDIADPTHVPMFHQVEGFAVDKDISFGDLKGTLEVFVWQMFGEERKVRLRPHYFPFTEPSVEVDISCRVCGGKGCRSCSGKGWLEILGAGMIDPEVFKHVGYDSEEVTGLAFGMGPARIAMLKYGVTDIRMFYENDLRFLAQF